QLVTPGTDIPADFIVLRRVRNIDWQVCRDRQAAADFHLALRQLRGRAAYDQRGNVPADGVAVRRPWLDTEFVLVYRVSGDARSVPARGRSRAAVRAVRVGGACGTRCAVRDLLFPPRRDIRVFRAFELRSALRVPVRSQEVPDLLRQRMAVPGL